MLLILLMSECMCYWNSFFFFFLGEDVLLKLDT